MEVKRTYVPLDELSKTSAIFDTGATGSIISSGDVLTDIVASSPTQCNGLRGSMTVAKTGILVDIGSVHYDPRAGLSVISASA